MSTYFPALAVGITVLIALGFLFAAGAAFVVVHGVWKEIRG